jgi:hypothetical protein
MKSNPKLRRYESARFASLTAILLFAILAIELSVPAQQRLGRPPARREVEGTSILPAGAQAIPEGQTLILEMEDRLDSGSARVSDRFIAHVAVPIVDAAGRTVLQPGTRIEGHVTNVQKARWRHRSGELGLSFDYILLGDRRIPIRGALVGSSKRIDEEGNLKAGSATKRDALITGGGAGAGAGIGVATGGGLLVGGGIGAAAGLTVALLMKGKDVVVRPGDRFNLELVQPIVLRAAPVARPTPPKVPIPLVPRTGSRPTLITPSRPVQAKGGTVPVHQIQAERGGDGYLRVLVIAETPTAGYRIYTYHEIRGDTLEVSLCGEPPSRPGARQISHPQAPVIIVQDPNNSIRRIVVHGTNGDRILNIGTGRGLIQTQPGTRPTSSTTQPARPRAGTGPSDGSSIGFNYPNSPSNGGANGSSTGGAARPATSLSPLATQVANSIQTLRANYAAYVGLFINPDGSADPFGQRRTTANERQLFDTLTYMLNSARSLSQPSISASDRRRAAQQLQDDTQTAQRQWQNVRSTGIISPDLDRQWQNLQGSINTLINVASR